MDRRIIRLQPDMAQIRTEFGAVQSDIHALSDQLNDARRELEILRGRADRIEGAVRGLIAELTRHQRLRVGLDQASPGRQVGEHGGSQEGEADNQDNQSD